MNVSLVACVSSAVFADSPRPSPSSSSISRPSAPSLAPSFSSVRCKEFPLSPSPSALLSLINSYFVPFLSPFSYKCLFLPPLIPSSPQHTVCTVLSKQRLPLNPSFPKRGIEGLLIVLPTYQTFLPVLSSRPSSTANGSIKLWGYVQAPPSTPKRI